MVRSVVHIGYPKTGTTTLQNLLFACHPEINYLGQSNVWESKDAKALLYALLTETGLPKAEAVLEKFRKMPGRLVISDEALSCGEFMQRAAIWSLTTDHAVMAERIHKIMGDVEIIIVIRRQDNWLESWYKQGLKTGKYISRSFSDWFNTEVGVNGRRRLNALLHYDKVYECYAGTFGHTHIHLFLYEDYQQCFHLLARDIAVRIGINAEKAKELMLGNALNVTGNEFTSVPLILRRFARTGLGRGMQLKLPGVANCLRLILSGKYLYPSATAQEKETVLQAFYDSNRRLFQHIKRSTDTHGYIPSH